MNQRDKLKKEKKRLPYSQILKGDVLYVGNLSVGDLYFTTSSMWRENHTIVTLKTLQSINLLYYHLLRRILNSFYYSVRHITTLLSGVRR